MALILGSLVALAAFTAFATVPAVLSAQGSISAGTHPAAAYTHATLSATVDLAHVAPAPPAAQHAPLPFLRPRAVGYGAPAPELARPMANLSATGNTEEVLSSWAGPDLNGQVQKLGGDQSSEPPDPTLAVGPDQVVLVDNASMWIYPKPSGTPAAVDLQTFFPVPANTSITSSFFTDPQILYDQQSARWFLSGLGVTQGGSSNILASYVYLAVSVAPDVSGSAGTWRIWTVRQNTNGLLMDQPKLGNSDDKIVMSWNDFTGNNYSGQETWVVQKSDLTSGNPGPAMAQVLGGSPAGGPDPNRFGLVPAKQTSSGATAWVTYNNLDQYNQITNPNGNPFPAGSPPSVGVVAINGTPLQGNVSETETFIQNIAVSAQPPNAVQPGPDYIATNDDRFLSTAWQNGVLWTAGNAACAAPSNANDCLEMVQVSTSGTVPGRLQDFKLAGSTGTDVYFPAVGLDSAGDMFVGFTESSSTQDPSVAASGQLAGAAPGSFVNPVTVIAGMGSYTSYAPGCFGTQNERWGDYSGAAVDPRDPTDVWITAEDDPSAANPNCDWGTGIGRLTFSAPNVSAINPAGGPAGGATQVTITGTDFLGGATTVNFGGAAATAVNVLSPDQLTAASPAGSGSVNVSVTTPDGTSPASPASQFTYTGSGPSPTPTASPTSSPTASPTVSPTASPSPPANPSGWVMDVYGVLHAYGGAPNIQASDSWQPGSPDGGANGFPIARGLGRVPDHPSWGYTLDGYGGVHPFGGAPPIDPRTGMSDYWGTTANGAPNYPGHPQNFDIARGVALNPLSLYNCVTGYVLDGYGGVHPFHDSSSCAAWPTQNQVNLSDYWGCYCNHADQTAPQNWDIARGIAVFPDTAQNGESYQGEGYVLDGYGGAHPFWLTGQNEPPQLPPRTGLSDYWGCYCNDADTNAPQDFDIARGIALNPYSYARRVTGYVLDGYGGVHAFRDPACGCPAARVSIGGYWGPRDLGHGLAVVSGGGAGVYADAYGEVYGFAETGSGAPAQPANQPSQGYPYAGAWGRGVA